MVTDIINNVCIFIYPIWVIQSPVVAPKFHADFGLISGDFHANFGQHLRKAAICQQYLEILST